MPQQSLLPEYPAMVDFRVDVRCWPHTPQPDQVVVTVSVSTGENPLKTRSVAILEGSARDYLNTMVSEATSAFMYEAQPKDVVRAVSAVNKLARSHAATHDF